MRNGITHEACEAISRLAQLSTSTRASLENASCESPLSFNADGSGDNGTVGEVCDVDSDITFGEVGRQGNGTGKLAVFDDA